MDKDKFYRRSHENEEKVTLNTIDRETTQCFPPNIEQLESALQNKNWRQNVLQGS